MYTDTETFVSTGQMDNRLKNLFSDLGGSFEPVDGQPGNGKIANESGDAMKPSTVIFINKARASACPFLHTTWDNSTRYGYPNEKNVCYKQKKPQPVSLTIQKEFCLTKQYGQCPLDVPLRKMKILKSIFLGLKGLPVFVVDNNQHPDRILLGILFRAAQSREEGRPIIFFG